MTTRLLLKLVSKKLKDAAAEADRKAVAADGKAVQAQKEVDALELVVRLTMPLTQVVQ